MQRNRLDQAPLIWLFYVLAFILYEALAMRHLYLPPLFGLLFFIYIRVLDSRKTLPFFAVLTMLIIAESAKGYLLLSTVFFFTLSYFTVLPKFKSVVSCRLCLNGFIVVYAYLGYFAFALLISQMFALPAPHLDFRMIFYMAIEFFLIGLL